MKVGDRVRVKVPVTLYHHPQHKGKPFEAQGQEGEVIQILTEWEGRPVSANFPAIVKFDKKFRAHFREDELETI